MQIMHQYQNLTGTIEIDNLDTDMELFGTDKKIGIRQIGIWCDNDYSRHIWLLFDFKGNNKWKPMVHWSDRGQYTALVKKIVTGAFKNPPPYREYPYGEENARMRIGLIGYVDVDRSWCRQINATKDIHGILDGKIEKEKEVIDDTKSNALWNSDETLKIDNQRIMPGTYANDETGTILFASAIDAEKQNAMFGILNGDAIWSGMDSRWYLNHHIIDSEVVNSSIEFNLLMGAADEIRIQLGNRSATGWILDNDYVFGGYEFIINKAGKVFARIEYFYGINEGGVRTSSYSLADSLGELSDFDPNSEIHVKASIKNLEKEAREKGVLGSLFIYVNDKMIPRAFTKNWKDKDWHVNENDIPKGRVDSKDVLKLYKGVKHHWSIQRLRIGNQKDNGSLINKIRVYKL